MANSSSQPILQWLLQTEQNGPRSELGDGELLRLFCERADTLAFTQLVQRYRRLVWRVCFRVLGHVQDAEDAFQATFIVLAKQASRIRKSQQLADWLHSVAWRISWKAKTMARRRRQREKAAAQQMLATDSPTVPDSDVQAVVHRELASLPAHYRTALILCDLQGLTRQQAAQQLGLAEGTLASRLARGRKLLAQRLRQAGLPVAAGLLAAPLQDALAIASSKLVTATCEQVRAVIAGETASHASTTAYLLARALLRSWHMMRMALWTGVVTVVVSGAMAIIVGLGALLANGPNATAVPAVPQSTQIEPSPRQEKQPAKVADRSSPLGLEPTTQHQQKPSTPQRYPDSEGQLDRALAQLPPAANPLARPAAKPQKPAAAQVTDQWAHRKTWEVEAPVAVAISPTGDYFAVADAFGSVRLYTLKDEKPQTLREPRKAPREVPPQQPAFAGGIGGPGNPIGPGNAKIKYITREEKIWDIAFSPSGTMIAVACGAQQHMPQVEIYALHRLQDKEQWRLDQQIMLAANDEPRRVAFAPDGKTLYVGGFGRMLASYEVGSGKLVRDWSRLLPREDLCEIRDLQVSSSGKYLAVTALWPPSAVGKPGRILPGQGPAIGIGQAVDQSISTSLVLLDVDKAERCWVCESRGKLSPSRPQLAVIERVAFSSDEKLLAAMRTDAQVAVMDLRSGKELRHWNASEPNEQMGAAPNKAAGKPFGGVGGGIFQGGGAMPRSTGLAGTPQYWVLVTSTPVLFFDPPTGRLITWDYHMPGLPGVPRLWDAQTGKALGLWDVSLTLRVGGNLGPKTLGVLGGETGRYLVTVEPQPAGGFGFVGGVFTEFRPPQAGQTEEDMVYVLPAAIRLYARDDSMK
ncbi:ECF RNA polymerase sigma factor SigE [bacterium HR36]|nr:ECF RNA polymerase sigma factor SigE [bacterium HR36]